MAQFSNLVAFLKVTCNKSVDTLVVWCATKLLKFALWSKFLLHSLYSI